MRSVTGEFLKELRAHKKSPTTINRKLDVRDFAPAPGDELTGAEDQDEGIDDEGMLGGDDLDLVEEAADADE